MLILDPHSPVPHFLFKLLSWKNKSFLEIVPELGLNSPLLQFLNISQQVGDVGLNKKIEERKPRRFVDPDED